MNKEYIIKESQVFDELIKSCPYRKNNSFIVFYRKKEGLFAKYGIATPKKLGKAVIRNKLKRRTRAIVSEFKKDYKNGYDCIIISRKGSLNKKYNILKEELFSLLLSININTK